MTIIQERLSTIENLTLLKGSHTPPDNGVTLACVMEAVAYVAGEDWSDSPECASPVIGAFLRAWNDQLPDDPRQQLKQYIPRLVGSRGAPEREDARAWLSLDWLVRTYTPVWLRAAGLNDQAATMEGLPEFRAGMDVPSIRPTIDAVRKDARAARAGARAAVWAAAGDAVWAAAGDAAGDAVWAAAGAAAGDAVWAAAGDAAGAAARAAAGDAVWAAAWDAAGAAAGAAVWAAAGDAARAAAWDAAGDALAPHVETLQQSAHELVDRMLRVTEVTS